MENYSLHSSQYLYVTLERSAAVFPCVLNYLYYLWTCHPLDRLAEPYNEDSACPCHQTARLRTTWMCLPSRSSDLNLTADLDVDAGLFLAPAQAGRTVGHGKQLCGFTLDARIVTFGPDSGGFPKVGVGALAQGGSSAAAGERNRTAHG